MSLLSAAKKPQNEPLIVTICGNPGSGKTSLAASFPKPFLIRTTGEAVPRDLAEAPDSLDEVQKVEPFWAQLMALLDEEHDYQTAIIDSVTGLEAMFTADVIEKDSNKPKSINQALGGWGAGRAAVASQHARVRRAAEALRKRRGMNVVFVAHADITRIDPPDADGYNAYTLRLNDKSMAPYVDSVDVVGFVKQHTILLGDDGNKKAVTTGDRILTCYMTPASCAKNRLGITEDIEFVQGENPIASYLTVVEKPKRKAKAEPVEPSEPTEPAEPVNEEEGNEA